MKVFKSKDSAYNFIHEDGMQTSIKMLPSGSFNADNVTLRDKPNLVDKEKYTVIISSSIGCTLACTFCELTKKNKPLTKTDANQIFTNVFKALKYVKGERPDIKDKYIKFCFQGEGEAILDITQLIEVVMLLKDNVLTDNSLCCGLDGVDISTCMPKVKDTFINSLAYINNYLSKNIVNLNPNNHSEVGRSVVRIFYSLHHYDQDKRNLLIPYTRSVDYSLNIMDTFSKVDKINGVVHYMFMNGINDSEQDVSGLIRMLNSDKRFNSLEFRVLRYNGLGGEDRESDNIENITKRLYKEVNGVGKLKIQYSSGEEINAACGMFI